MFEVNTFEGDVKGIFPDSSIVEEIDLGDLSTVKEEKQLVPPTKNVKFLIKSASVSDSKKNPNWRTINLDLRIADGIPVGEKMMYKNKPIQKNVCYYASMDGVNKNGELYADQPWFQKRQHLVEFTQLCKALSLDLPTKMTNSFVSSLNGRYVSGNIMHKPNRWTKADGTFVDEFKEEVKGFKPCELGI